MVVIFLTIAFDIASSLYFIVILFERSFTVGRESRRSNKAKSSMNRRYLSLDGIIISSLDHISTLEMIIDVQCYTSSCLVKSHHLSIDLLLKEDGDQTLVYPVKTAGPGII